MPDDIPDKLKDVLAEVGAAFESCEQAVAQSTPALMAASGVLKTLAGEAVAAVTALGTLSTAFAKTVADMLATAKQSVPQSPALQQPGQQPSAPGPKQPASGGSAASRIASGLQAAMTAGGEAFKGFNVAAGKAFSTTYGLRQAFQSTAQAMASLGGVFKVVVAGAAKLGAVMSATFAGIVVAANQLAKLPMAVLEKSIASVGSEIGKFVQLAQPGVFQLFDRAIKDLYASIGIALIPVLEKATQVFRAIGGALYGLTGNGKLVLQVLAVASVSLVTLGAVLGGLAVASVGAAVAVTAFVAAIELLKFATTGGLANLLTAVGAALVSVATAAGALAGVGAVLASVVVAVTGVLTDLNPVLNQVASTIAVFLDSLGTAFKAFAGSGLLMQLAKMFDGAARAVGGFIVQLAPAFAALVNIFVKLLPIATTIVSVLAKIVATPFIALAKAFELVAPMIEAFAEAFADSFASIGELVFDIAKAIGELLVEFVVLNPVVQLLGGLAKELGIMLAGLALAMKDMIVNIVGWLRDILGLSAMQAAQPGKPKDNTGAAVTSASTGDPRDALRKAREAAFQLGTGGAKPEEQTAKNTGEIARAIQDVRASINEKVDAIVTGVTNFPTEVKNFVKEVAQEFINGVDRIVKNPAKAVGGAVDRAAESVAQTPLAGAILRQLDKLDKFNPFS